MYVDSPFSLIEHDYKIKNYICFSQFFDSPFNEFLLSEDTQCKLLLALFVSLKN